MYNTIIRGFLRSQLTRNCLLLYSQMLQDSVTLNKFTFPPVIRACSVSNAVEEGEQVHAHVLKFGLQSDGFSQNNLIYMYVNFLCLEEARRIFDNNPKRDVVSWITLISGYSRLGCVDQAREFFELMPVTERSSVSWNAMIAAYVQSNRFHEALAMFGRMRSEEVVLDKDVAATISDMYCKCGCLDKAFDVFNGLPTEGVSSWNCMIGGLAMHGKGEAAIVLLKNMEREAVAPDYVTFVNVLSACAHSGLIEEGRHYFHHMTEVYGVEPGKEHFGCMVDLLGRAGKLEEARMLIDEMPMSPEGEGEGDDSASAANKGVRRLGGG
ncbi:hypothetical protein RJ639_019253 [Escallonia herrerae]|uniref:Pentatricopeptide repeat-containing protein n=1 Tax=Escallonia herrerae TaxID=1293975 RepID=A0AA88V8I7_9ASTE|nr:hypothetical protein RJ639_019253 [Escallonia herrerae]